MSITTAVAALQAHALAVGVQSAPDGLPESANVFPFSVSYPANGVISSEAQAIKGLHTIFTELHFSRALLDSAVQQATPYIETFADRLIDDPTLGGAVDTIVMERETPIRYAFGRLEWGGVETIGIRFQITVKIKG